MKKRTLTISLIVLAIMLLVGIGYAGWVITRSDSDSAEGNFTAYGVTDTGSLEVSDYDNNVIFGKDTASATNNWLTATEDVRDEDLIALFTVKWSGGAQSFNLTHTFSTTVSPLLIGGPTMELNAAVTGVSLVNNVLAFTADYAAYTEVVIKVTYKFGTLFNELNPYQFFNNKAVDGAAFDGSGNYNGASGLTLTSINEVLTHDLNANAKYADVAKEALSDLNTLVTGLTCTVAVAKA